jgi:hypothetical protein
VGARSRDQGHQLPDSGVAYQIQLARPARSIPALPGDLRIVYLHARIHRDATECPPVSITEPIKRQEMAAYGLQGSVSATTSSITTYLEHRRVSNSIHVELMSATSIATLGGALTTF